MDGLKNLDTLIKSMSPKINEGQYVFCTLENPPQELLNQAILTFTEAEGKTLIVQKQTANNFGLTYNFLAALITLSVHSALDAVGLTATFSTALARQGISCNVVAGYYHDHIFVDLQKADQAIEALNKISSQ